MRNLRAETSSAPDLTASVSVRPIQQEEKHERSRRRHLDGKEPQAAGYRPFVRGRRVSGRPDRRGRAKGRRCLYRHAQRAGRVLRGAGLRLSEGPPRRLHRRDRPRCRARSRGPRQCAAELLADDPDRRRLGDLSRRHGRLPGRAPGIDRLALLQIRACHRYRRAHPLLSSRWRRGTRSMAVPAPPTSTFPTT